MSVVISDARPLRYRQGPDAASDRPAHVRAASGIAWFGSRLAVVQDDANFIALVDPVSAEVDALPLPAGPDNVRLFDVGRGNKKHKLDLEACFTIGDTLIALGSGSAPPREVVVRVRADAVDVIRAPELYALLFPGGGMNIEGAVIVGDQLRLFSRGNGHPAVNATCDLSLAEFLAYLDRRGAPPPPTNVISFDLGSIDGVRLGFTDAAVVGDRVMYAAAAEASPNAIDDGVVVGSTIGVIDGARATHDVIVDEEGEPFRGKVEGIAPDPTRRDHLFAVVDVDDHDVPSLLASVCCAG